MRRWMLWFPVLMVASALYWTLALGLGGLSLMALTTTGPHGGGGRGGCPAARDSVVELREPIFVHLEGAQDEVGNDVDEALGPADEPEGEDQGLAAPEVEERQIIEVELESDGAGRTAF